MLQIPVKPGSYEKPKRNNKSIPEAKYDKVDKTCQEEVFLSNDGNVYVPQKSMNTIFNTTKKKGRFIYDNQLDDEDKRVINGTNTIKSSEVVLEMTDASILLYLCYGGLLMRSTSKQ